MTDKVGFGLIGAGQIALNAAKILGENSSVELVAAHDVHAGRLADLSAAAQIPQTYATAEAFAGDERIQAVYIAVPNKFHAELAIQMLEAGKHVILEKPFAMNASEAEAVVAAAKKAGTVFTLGMNQRFVLQHQKIKALVKQGVFGEIYHVKAFWLRRTGIPKLGTWFGRRELAGGGCLNDIGVHALDLALYAIGRYDPVTVSGATYMKFGHRGKGEGKWGMSDRTESVFDVDDFATALLRFEDGLTLTLDTSWACHMENANHMGVHLFGDEAGADVMGAKLFYEDPLRTTYAVVDDVRAEAQFPHCCRFTNFINAILGKEELCVTPEQALQVQRILDAIQQSAASGKEVTL